MPSKDMNARPKCKRRVFIHQANDCDKVSTDSNFRFPNYDMNILNTSTIIKPTDSFHETKITFNRIKYFLPK